MHVRSTWIVFASDLYHRWRFFRHFWADSSEDIWMSGISGDYRWYSGPTSESCAHHICYYSITTRSARQSPEFRPLLHVCALISLLWSSLRNPRESAFHCDVWAWQDLVSFSWKSDSFCHLPTVHDKLARFKVNWGEGIDRGKNMHFTDRLLTS